MQSFLNVITLQTYTFFTTLTPRLHGRSKRFFRRPQNLNAPRKHYYYTFKFCCTDSLKMAERISAYLCMSLLNEPCSILQLVVLQIVRQIPFVLNGEGLGGRRYQWQRPLPCDCWCHVPHRFVGCYVDRLPNWLFRFCLRFSYRFVVSGIY